MDSSRNKQIKRCNRRFSTLCGIFVISVLATVVWMMILLRNGSSHLTLNPQWCDNASNFYSTQIFFHHGYDIYRYPLSRFLRNATPNEEVQFKKSSGFIGNCELQVFEPEGADKQTMMIVSPKLPRPYPPGIYLLTAIPSFLTAHKLMNPRTALMSLESLWIFLAHVSFFILLRKMRDLLAHPRVLDWILASILAFTAYCEWMRWTLNAQYDIAAIFPLLLAMVAYNRTRYLESLLMYSCALLINFRCLFYLPLAFFAASAYLLGTEGRFRNAGTLLIRKLKSLTWKECAILTIVAAQFLAAGIAFLFNYPSLKNAATYHHEGENGAYIWNLGLDNLSKTIPLVVGFSLTSFFFWRRREYLALACVLCTTIVYVSAPLSREWYAMFFYPFVILLEPSARQSANRCKMVIALTYITYMSAVFANNSPFEFRFIKELAALVR